MRKFNNKIEYNRIQKFSIRKYSFGAASVAIATYLLFMGNGAVFAEEATVSENTTAKIEEVLPTSTPKKEEAPKVVKSAEEKAQKELIVSKEKLSAYVQEIEANLTSGKYASKTDESLSLLRSAIAEAKQASTATTKAEVEKAYANLITTVNAKLISKPIDKKELPTVDTTNGKETAGKKAENTEKKSDSNSIENTGSKDSRNGQALDKNTAFRAETTATHGNFNYSMEYSNGKEIYLYNEEDADVNITVSSTAGNITKATVKAGSGQFVLKSKSDQAIAHAKGANVPMPQEEEVETDGYGWSYHQTLSETQGPVKIKITGKPNDTFKGLKSYTKTEDQRAVLGARYLQLEDSAGGRLSGGNNPSAPGYFNLVVKSQTYKYNIQSVTEENKVAVADINKLTTDDINKIKEKINIQYSDKATKEDARLASKKGEVLQDRSTVVKEVTVANGTVTVTYNDDSVDTTPVANVARTNPVPTVELPYSNADKRQIYVYTGENTDLTFKASDDTTVKDLYLRGPGGVGNDNAASYGFTTGKIDNGAITNGEGTVSADKRTATIKMTGITTLKAPNQWTSFIEAKDNDDFKSMTGANYDASTDDAVRQQKPGYVQFIVKSQTDKYNIKAPTEKVTVADPSNVTEADLAKIKEKLQLEHNKDNDDANISKDAPVTDKDAKIKSVTKDTQGNLVVTYTDGSTDKRQLSEFVTLNKQPAIDAVNKAAEDKIAEINKTPNATDEEKAAAIAKVNADKEKAVAAINDANVTTKAELDKAKEAGATAIAADNTVVAKKDAAKADVEAARKAKADAITADKNLSQAEKDAAIGKINKAAEDATKAIDAATSDAAVDTAKNTGTTEFGKVNPIAKENAKEAIANSLTAKNQEIDNRTDLTQKEKDAAKSEARKLADAELAKVDAQPDNAATADAAVAAQKLVNDAEDKGVADVTSVHPLAKEQAKKEVADELTKKEAEIDARKDLTQEEKAAAKKEAQDKAKVATDAINAQPAIADSEDKVTAAQQAIDTAKNTGVLEVKAVNPEAKAKPAAKKVIDDALKAKESEIDARTDLTDDEKTAAKEEAKAAADKAKENVDKATTDAAVKEAENTGTSEVKAVNPEAKSKPAAKKAIDDKLAEQLKTIENTPDATDEEKAEAIQKAQDAAEQAKQAIADAKTDAEVNTAKETGVVEVEKVLPVVETKPNARKAIEEEAKAKKAAIDARDDLSPKAKEALKAKVDKVANKAKAAIDAVSSVDDVNVIEEADKAAIKAIGDINRPIDKVLVKDPSILTDEEKAKILEEVKKVNPTAKEVKYNENGKIEVTTGNGDKGTINPAKLVKTEEDLDNGKGGNDINKPLDRVIVKDPANITDEEKSKIVAEVEEVNPDAIVSIDENGIVSVSTPDGKTSAIPASDLVRTKEDTEKAGAGNSSIVKPADKIVGEANDPDDQAKAEEKLRELNPDTKSVKFDGNGNATVTLNDGTTATIPSEDLFRSEADAAKPNAGNDIVKLADKTVVANPNVLTPEEKKAIGDKVKAVNPGATVVVDDKGNATVTTPEGKTAVIPATDLTKSAEEAAKPNAGNDIVKPADKTVVANPDALTPEEKKAIEDKVKAVNPDATVAVDDKGNATVTLENGKTAVILATDLVKSPEDATKPNAGNDIVKPADKTAVANPEKLTAAEKKAIEEKVKAVNPGATVAVDDKGNATVTTPEGKTAVIPATDLVKSQEDATKPNAGNDIVKPADKTVVANPNALTPEEKKAIEDKVKVVNPGVTVVIDDKGNATVTTPEGKTAVIPATDLVKSQEDATKPNAGNDIVKPADKTVIANPNALTPEEKKAIEDKVKAVNPGATVVVDDKGNATVTTPEGKTAVIPATDLVKSPEDATKPNAGNDIVKPADKTVVANPEKLTDAEKKAIEDKVKVVNPGATVVIDDKGNATVTTPEGKTAVIPATDLVKSPEDATKPNAGNDIVKPADKTVVSNSDSLTQDEKDAIVAKVKAVNPDAKVVVDDKGNATVTTPEGKTAVIPSADLTKSADAKKSPNAGNDIVKPASKTKVANPEQLTDAEKKAIEDKVKAVNPDAKVVVDDKGNSTVTLLNGKTAVIPASDLTKSEKDVNDGKAKDNAVTPAAKTKVANPEKLTDAEKKAIEDKVKAANPGAEIVVDDKGNATVVTKGGNVSVIPSTDLVKVEDDAKKDNGGNDANTPAAKTVVKDPANLTDEEKAKVKKAVEAVNPGSTVVVDDKGNATVTKADGTVLNIPSTDLVIPAEKFADEAKNAKVKTPAIRTLVGDKENLTKDEKEAVKKSIEAVNPGATVVVDDKGNATVTMPDGSTATISKEQLVKDKEAVSKSKHGGDNLDIDLSKVEVADLANITPEEKAKFQFKVLGAITDVEEFDLDAYIKSTDENGNTVYTSKDSKVKITIDKDGNATVEKDGKKEAAVSIDKAGNVTIVTKEGQVLAIPRDDAFKQRPAAPQYDGYAGNPGNTASKVDKAKLESGIRNLDSLIASQANQLDAAKVKEAKALLAEAKEVFAKANATQAEVDAMVKRLEEFKLNQASVATDDQAANNAANASNGETPEDATDAKIAANVSKRNKQKELPNTGTSTFGTILPAMAALLSGVGLFAKKKKEDE